MLQPFFVDVVKGFEKALKWKMLNNLSILWYSELHRVKDKLYMAADGCRLFCGTLGMSRLLTGGLYSGAPRPFLSRNAASASWKFIAVWFLPTAGNPILVWQYGLEEEYLLCETILRKKKWGSNPRVHQKKQKKNPVWECFVGSMNVSVTNCLKQPVRTGSK